MLQGQLVEWSRWIYDKHKLYLSHYMVDNSSRFSLRCPAVRHIHDGELVLLAFQLSRCQCGCGSGVVRVMGVRRGRHNRQNRHGVGDGGGRLGGKGVGRECVGVGVWERVGVGR